MDFSQVIDFFRQFETTRVMDSLQRFDLGELIHNRYFLGGTAVLALLALLMRWKLLLVTLLGLAGFVGLLHLTLQKGTDPGSGLQSDALLFFVGGGVVLIGLVIYFLFIRTE